MTFVGVDMGVVFVLFAEWVVSDVGELVCVVVEVADAVIVVAGMPDLAWGVLSGGEGVAALDELYAAGCGLIGGWCEEDMDVIGHNGEGVELEPALIFVVEERGDEEFGVWGSLEVAMLFVGGDGDGVCALASADGDHSSESLPQGLTAPSLPRLWEAQG